MSWLMRFKARAEDFLVDELIDESRLKERDEGLKKPFRWFRLIKRETEQLAAVDAVARLFRVPTKHVHIAGIKDRMGITAQNVVVYGITEAEAGTAVRELAGRPGSRIFLEDKGALRGRIEASDLLGNRFTLTLRDGTDREAEEIRRAALDHAHTGFLNRFDDQRFGYAGNSHKIGRLMILNDFRNALCEILSALPDRPRSELKPDMLAFHNLIVSGWDAAADAGDKDFYALAARRAPGFLRSEIQILRHLETHPRDFLGAFRTIPRRLRFLYLSAYQADIFNRTLDHFRSEILDGRLESIPLAAPDMDWQGAVGAQTAELIRQDGVSPADLQLRHLPEFGLRSVLRPTRVIARDMETDPPSPDDMFPGRWKMSIRFTLGPGEYATMILKELAGAPSAPPTE